MPPDIYAACAAACIAAVLVYLPVLPAVKLAAVFVAANVFSRTAMFQNWVRRAAGALDTTVAAARNERLVRNIVPGTKSEGNDSRFMQLRDAGRLEVLTAIRLLEAYAANCKRTSARRHRLFKMMSWRQQKLCTEVGYLDKLAEMDRRVGDNQKFLSAIAKHAIDHYGIKYRDFDLLRNHEDEAKNSSSNYRVIEALTHFSRDWDADAQEIEPLLNYIKLHLSQFVRENDLRDTCIIVPGSGLGRIAHEIASSAPYAAVHAVEFSGLMHICNQFMYSQEGAYVTYPYVHNCSNFTSMANQFRTSKITTHKKPENLHLHQEDFRYFKPNSYKNVVVVTAFFMDTAENLIDYMDTINELTRGQNGVKNGYWINVGPLKYGTAARVELNAEEFAHLRKRMGWQDIDNRISLDENQLVGYTTDKESLWQGYYGLAMWASKRKLSEKEVE